MGGNGAEEGADGTKGTKLSVVYVTTDDVKVAAVRSGLLELTTDQERLSELLRPVIEDDDAYEEGTLILNLASLYGISPVSYVMVDVFDNAQSLVQDVEVVSRAKDYAENAERVAGALSADVGNTLTIWGPAIVDTQTG